MQLDIDKMTIQELKQAVKSLIELIAMESDRTTALQERVLELELLVRPLG